MNIYKPHGVLSGGAFYVSSYQFTEIFDKDLLVLIRVFNLHNINYVPVIYSISSNTLNYGKLLSFAPYPSH